jgi:Flp pilus assembly protein TadD
MARIDRLEAFHLSDPDNPALAGELVDALLAEGRLGQAEKMFASLSATVRADPGLRFREARCALLSGHLPEAAELLEALELTPVQGPVLRHDLAFVQLMMGRVDAASKTLEPALGDPSAPAAVYVLHARLLHWRGDYAGGLQAIDVALARSPDDADARGVQALLLLDQGDREAARAAAQAASVSGGFQPEAAIVLGTLALWEQRPDEAGRCFTKVLARQPQSGRALLGAGQVQMLRGDLDAARGTLERAVAIMPGHIGSWHALAWCQLLVGDLPSAQSSYEKALALDRSFGETHGGLAIIRALRGETSDAEAEIKRARKLDPNGRSAVYAHALLYLAAGRDKEAKRLVTPLLAATASCEDPLEILKRLRERMQGR